MNRVQRLVQNREKTNKIIIFLAILAVICLIVNYMFYEELGIFFFIAIGSILLIGFFIYQINEYKKPTEAMINFELEHENFSKLYVNLTGRPNLDDLMVKSIDGKKPVVGKDNYGIFIYIVDKDEELLNKDSEESAIEYVEEISDEKMEEIERKEEKPEKVLDEFDEVNNKNCYRENSKDMEEKNITYLSEIFKDEEVIDFEIDDENKIDDSNKVEKIVKKKEINNNRNYPKDKYTRIRIDKRKLERKLKRKFHTDKDTINLIYEFSIPNSRYALRYFDDVDRFTINNFY